MAITKSVEYYTECPSCGATNTGNEVCEYCGASLIKSKSTIESEGPDTIEDEYFRGDAGLKQIYGKSANLDPFTVIFCSIFGGCFIVVPFIIGFTFISTGIAETWAFAMLGMFVLIGVGSFSPIVIKIVNKSKVKNGEEISGTVRGYSNSLSSINNAPVLNVHIKIYADGEEKIVILNTGVTERRYPVGSTIYLKRNGKIFLIEDNE